MNCHHKLDALPVISDTGKPVRMVTADILNGLLNTYEEAIGESENSKRTPVFN